MGKLNKAILSPVIKDQESTLFNVAGHNFKMTGENIERVNNIDPIFTSLVEAKDSFTFEENSISFYYDYNNKTRIFKVEDAALESFNVLVDLEKKVNFFYFRFR